MNFDRRAVAALAAAGILWGCTVPATKLAVHYLAPGWLTIVRFGLAAAILLVARRKQLRAACSPAVLAWGAVGYGGTIFVQNAGVMRTSVSHAALLVGRDPGAGRDHLGGLVPRRGPADGLGRRTPCRWPAWC